MPFYSNASELPDLTNAFAQPLPDSLVSLGTDFYTRLPAAPIPAPYLIGFSEEAAALLGFDAQLARNPAFIEWFAGNQTHLLAPHAQPFATVYSGHQFGVWAGQLGDGRALMLGEIEHQHTRYEVQLKGAGPTPYARMGDGRAVLRSSIREFLCSEAMHHLGVPTTRALCVIGSDLPVRREQIETAAVATRIAPSFVRFGHFEHFYACNRADLIAQLADHVIARHYPECQEAANPYLALFKEVTLRTADLLAHWQSIGFCHGVMNTDNMSILGLTIDYGPYGFIDEFNFNHICNHSDHAGRYAYQQQPHVAYWNLACLARALLPIIDKGQIDPCTLEEVQQALDAFKTRFAEAFRTRMRSKLGLTHTHEDDDKLIEHLFKTMHENHADFTLTFRQLAQISSHHSKSDTSVSALFADRSACQAWLCDYRTRLSIESRDDIERAVAMNRVNPKYVLRNYLVENAIQRAKQKDFSEVEQLLNVLRHPFDEAPKYQAYAQLPPSWASSLEVSCSS